MDGRRTVLTWLAALLLLAAGARADAVLRPFFAGADLAPPLETAQDAVLAALAAEGFELLGVARPVDGARVLVLGHPELLAAAGASADGAYAAVQRVSLVERGDVVQTAAFDPLWLAASCRLEADLSGLRARLVRALGGDGPFGCEDGLGADKLRKYHYMMSMPYYDDRLELAEHADHAAALAAVERGLASGAGGVREVARIDLPGREATLFCVQLTAGPGADREVLGTVDAGERSQVAHLPYELLVTGGRVEALHAKFRIANSFPDLSMGTFMKIVKAPGGIEDALEAVARGGQ